MKNFSFLRKIITNHNRYHISYKHNVSNYQHKNFRIHNIIQNSNKKFSNKYSNFQKITKKNFFKRCVNLHKWFDSTFYEVLGVERDSNKEDIERAFLKLSKEYHPEVNNDSGAEYIFKDICLAYETLSDQTNKDLYDAYMDSHIGNNDFYNMFEELEFKKQRNNDFRDFYKANVHNDFTYKDKKESENNERSDKEFNNFHHRDHKSYDESHDGNIKVLIVLNKMFYVFFVQNYIFIH